MDNSGHTVLPESQTRIRNNPKRRRWLVFWIYLIGLGVISPAVYLYLQPSTEDQLKAIDKTRAIPDHENAALMYARLLEDYEPDFNMSDFTIMPDDTESRTILEDIGVYPYLQECNGSQQTYYRPWSRTEYPEVAQWLQEHSNYLNILVKASTFKECRFLVCLLPSAVPRNCTYQEIVLDIGISRLSHHIRRDAYLDMGEGRETEAFQKALAIMKIGRHLQQHPTYSSLYFGLILEIRGMQILNSLLLTGEEDLVDLDALLDFSGQLEDQWDLVKSRADLVMALISQRDLKEQRKFLIRNYPAYLFSCIRNGNWDGLIPSLSYGCGLSVGDPRDMAYNRYSELLLERKIHRLFIEARRYKNLNGQWPIRVDQLTSFLPSEAMDELKIMSPLTRCFADEYFLLYNANIDNNDIEKRDLLIQDERRLTLHEKQFIDRHLRACFDRIVNVKEPSREDDDFEDEFFEMAKYSIPMLLKKLKHEESTSRIEALDMLGKMADPECIFRNVSFLDQLLEEYYQEPNDVVKERYLDILGFFSDVPEETQNMMIQSLKYITHEGETEELRTAAAMALIRANRVHGIYEIFQILAEEGWDAHFGEKGGLNVFQLLESAIYSNHLSPYYRHGYGYQEEGLWYGMRSIYPSVFKRLNQWYQENKEKLQAILDGAPNTPQLMTEIFTLTISTGGGR